MTQKFICIPICINFNELYKPAEIFTKAEHVFVEEEEEKNPFTPITEQAFLYANVNMDDKVPKFREYVLHRCSVHKVMFSVVLVVVSTLRLYAHRKHFLV